MSPNESPTQEQEEWVATIRDDQSSGASELARKALELLVQYARSQPDNEEGRRTTLALARALRDCRPAMPGIGHLLQRWLDKAERNDLPGKQERVDAAEALLSSARNAARTIGETAADLIPDGAQLLTHSWSSSVAALAGHLGSRVHWWVTRSEPDQEGLKLAQRIADEGGPVTVCTEAQAELVMPRITAVVVGADRVLGDGSVVNKAGTALLARSAAAWQVPLLCLCESFKQVAEQDYDPEPHDSHRVSATCRPST